MSTRYRSREDFEEDDYRRTLPRFSEENFPKNLAVVDHMQKIADKHHATSGQVTLAWMLAEHPDCTSLLFQICSVYRTLTGVSFPDPGDAERCAAGGERARGGDRTIGGRR